MKKMPDQVEWEHGFQAVPDAFHTCVQNALCKLQAESKQEEQKVKKVTYRSVLIAAIVLIAMMGVAFALVNGNTLGWNDLAERSGTYVPEAGKKVMEDSGVQTFYLGNMRYDVKEMLCDGHIATASVHVSLTDGSQSLLCAEPFDPIGAVGENGKKLAEKLGVNERTSWVDAAKQLNMKLYRVGADLDLPVELQSDGGMSEMLWNEDGTAVCYTMWYMNGEAKGEKVDMNMDLFLAEMDLETGEQVNIQRSKEAISMYLEAPIETRLYRFAEGTVIQGYRLEKVEGELTPAGLYLTAVFTAPDGKTMDEFFENDSSHEFWFTDENGERFPNGISFSGSLKYESFPVIVMGDMISADAMPEKMTMHAFGEEVTIEK